MRLKSLEIKGFKSFADKTLVVLDHPITGIVGPNGCGKSNIVDAIRWVIGEHKIKSLRSDNLEDLIFNGSRSRAASNMAEVSLTFENTKNLLPTEFTTVTITRKFYRSGESEYRLNDVSCRLKDIHNLFLDTGVSNDSYAIIELGMVDDIIKDKEGSRRRMLEQAAGISIYKTRKKEAKQKLESTQQDIARIEDLLFEIANNLRTLEGQAKKAERYFQIKEEYKLISIELAKASLEEFNDQYQQLNDQLTLESDRKMAIETSIAGDEADIQSNKVKLIQKEQELSGLQKQFNELLNRIRILEGEKKLAAQRLDHLKDREKTLTLFLQNADQQLEQLQRNIRFASEQISLENNLLEEHKVDLEQLRDNLEDKKENFEDKKKVINEIKNNVQALQKSQFEAEKKVAIADTSIFSIQKNKQQLKEENDQRLIQKQGWKEEEEDKQGELQEWQEKLSEQMEQQELLQGRIMELQQELEAINDESVKNNRQLDAKRNEFKLLKSLVDSLEGYPDSIKFLKNNLDWSSEGILVSDIFQVKDEYRTALENVLDQYLNYYIVAELEDAIRAIELLENKEKGKANFLLLNDINSLKQEKKAPLIANCIAALSVVQVDEKYQQLAQFLLGHVYIQLNEEEIKLPKELNDVIIITQSGKRLQGSFKVGGGSIGAFEGNKIGRAKTLELLDTAIQELSMIQATLTEDRTLRQNILYTLNQSLKPKEIEVSKQEINKLNVYLMSLNNKLEQHELQYSNALLKIEDLEEQLESSHNDISDTREELAQLNDQMNLLTAEMNNAEREFSLIEQDFAMSQQQFNQQNIALTKQHSKIENLKQEVHFRSNQLQDLLQQIENNQQQLRETSAQISETDGKLNFGDNELYELLIKKEKDERELNQKDNDYYAFRNQISEHENQISKQRRDKESADTVLNALKEKINQMQLQVAGMRERLNVEFKVDLETILQEERTLSEHSVEILNIDADRLKKRLENIGEINPTAIEAYNEMKLRHDFIVGQKEDLEDARNTLLATIEEVENTANEKFKATFDAVRENFVTVFKALFTEEDKADLKLTDPENIADSGIEIYAQPKGKRPSTLTQLSGGEKTLTSTAFLFAIYLIKPAPFCILDEVDAPLDDANVGKFTNMIRQFSDNSQFIMVTHNKQTMASVDVIYGVTMQEAGVSKLVSVDFRSLN